MNREQVSIFLNIAYSLILCIALIANLFTGSPLPTTLYATLSVIGIIPVLISATRALVRKKLTIDLLASIALLFSFIAAEWYSAAFINLMLSFARILDIWTEAKTKRIIQRLLKYRPHTVRVKVGDTLVEKPIDDVRVDDLVVIQTGERVPVDGTVVSGMASVNESTLTGESNPQAKKPGHQVFSSTFLESGSLVVLAQKVGDDSTLSRIIRMVEEASRSKARAERIADRFTQNYILIMFIGSFLLLLATRNTHLVLSILLVVCADDIAVAVPMSFTVAIARAAKRGIIIKGSDVIEKLSKLNIIVTDKTGTLTEGKPVIVEIRALGAIPSDRILTHLGMIAAASIHPIDMAILQYVKQQHIPIISADNVTEYPGDGVIATKGNDTYRIGKTDFLKKQGIRIQPQDSDLLEGYTRDGLNTSVLSVNDTLAAIIVFEDDVKPDVRTTIEETKQMGVRSWVMLTGDNERIASRVASRCGITEYHANVTPEDKLTFTKQLKRDTQGTVAMIGDGVNDAAALALADVSIAMGVIGSDTAIEASDIALMNDDIEKVGEAMRIGSSAMRIVRQNFALWGITNTLGLLLVLTGVLDPVGAATYNFATDFFPILNSFRVGLGRSTRGANDGHR